MSSAVAKGKLRAGAVSFGPGDNSAFKVFGSDAPTTANGAVNVGHVDHSVGPTQYTAGAYPSLLRHDYENGNVPQITPLVLERESIGIRKFKKPCKSWIHGT